MATTVAQTIIATPKKRSEGLAITLRAMYVPRIIVGYGAFYGALIALLVVFIYPAMSSINLGSYISSPAISGLIGGRIPNINSFGNVIALELFSSLYGLIFGGIMAYVSGAALPLNIENGMLDLALSRPISRTRYYLETTLGVFASGILMGLFILFCVWIVSLFVKNPGIDWQWAWITQLVQFAFFVFAIGVGLLIGSLVDASRTSGGVAVGLIFLGYLINIFGGISTKFDWLLKIGPFYYAPATDVFVLHQLTWWHPLVLVAAGLICGIIGLVVFNRRDLPTV